jgi:uncharacterized metal-binding protein YceD (DUF177 family)
MCIDLRALEEGVAKREYRLDDDFFRAMGEGSDVHGGEATAQLAFTKVEDRAWRVDMDIKGEVIVPCDRCLDDMHQHVELQESLTLRLASDPAQETDDDGDTLYVDERDAFFDASWPVMEAVLLAIPIQHVHETGLCNDAMVKALNEHSAARSGEGEAFTTAPAANDGWKEQLKNLKTN